MRLLLLGICALFLTGCVLEGTDSKDIMPGDQVPAFRVQMDDGTFLSSEDLLGKSSLILFFHTSCPDCARTIPVVQKAYERYAGQIRFVAISRAQNADEIKSWWKEFGITIPFSAQKDRQVYQLFASSRIPRVYICNSKGIVVSSYDDNPCPTYENLEQDLDKLQ